MTNKDTLFSKRHEMQTPDIDFKYVYYEKDVKEFIRLLKEEIKYFRYSNDKTWTELLYEINKLIGFKLIEENKT